MKRRNFLLGGILGGGAMLTAPWLSAATYEATKRTRKVSFMDGLVISTWNAGLVANEHAWKIGPLKYDCNKGMITLTLIKLSVFL